MDCSWARRRGSAGEISAREGAELSGRKQIADCRIVDLRSQRPGSIECAGFSEAGSIDGGPQEKLSDSSTCSDRLELVDTPHSRRRSMLDCNSAEAIEPVRLDPEVRIGEAAANLRRVDEQRSGRAAKRPRSARSTMRNRVAGKPKTA